jgi:GxxExxY protein
MHPLFEKASGLTETIIGAVIEVHRNKGPGLIESIYEWCLLKELGLRGLECITQKSVLIEYKGFTRRSRCASMYWCKAACLWKSRL